MVAICQILEDKRFFRGDMSSFLKDSTLIDVSEQVVLVVIYYFLAVFSGLNIDKV